MRRESKASKISDMVNNTLFDPLSTGVELSTDHRYLVNEEFKMFLHFVGQLSRNYDKGYYDDEILNRGGKIYHITPKSKGVIRNFINIYKKFTILFLRDITWG